MKYLNKIIGLLYFCSVYTHATIIDGTILDGTDAYYGSNALHTFENIGGYSAVGDLMDEDDFRLHNISVRNYGSDSPLLSRFGSVISRNCSNPYQECRLTQTDFAQVNSGNVGLDSGWAMGFALSNNFGLNFSLDSVSLLPNGWDPHLPGHNASETILYVGESFDLTRPLYESMDAYSLGTLSNPRRSQTIDFGDQYSDVNELYFFTSTDAFWDNLVVSSTRESEPIEVNEPYGTTVFLLCSLLIIVSSRKYIGT